MIKAEEIFVNSIIPLFEIKFKVTKEVWSKCHNGRIDLLLSLNNDVHFGIECKTPDKKRGEQIGKYIKQAVRYTDYQFYVGNGIYKKIPIFICPPLSYNYLIMKEETINVNGLEYHKDRHHQTNTHHTVNGILGSFLIGEVRSCYKNTYNLIVSNKVIFNSTNGLDVKNYNYLIKKLSI